MVLVFVLLVVMTRKISGRMNEEARTYVRLVLLLIVRFRQSLVVKVYPQDDPTYPRFLVVYQVYTAVQILCGTNTFGESKS